MWYQFVHIYTRGGGGGGGRGGVRVKGIIGGGENRRRKIRMKNMSNNIKSRRSSRM